MSTASAKPIEIPKEKIKGIEFSETEILPSKEDTLQRKIDLQRAAVLGAHSKSNIKIYFADNAGKRYKVVATVWASTEKNITLKGEVMIPIQSIYKVGFF